MIKNRGIKRKPRSVGRREERKMKDIFKKRVKVRLGGMEGLKKELKSGRKREDKV